MLTTLDGNYNPDTNESRSNKVIQVITCLSSPPLFLPNPEAHTLQTLLIPKPEKSEPWHYPDLTADNTDPATLNLMPLGQTNAKP